MRALEPKIQSTVHVDGVRIGYEVFGAGPRAIVLTPPWAIVPSRIYKAQAPYLARHFRVVTFDARGSGRSEAPEEPGPYGGHADVRDALAVLDAAGIERVLAVGGAPGALTALALASLHPDRVGGGGGGGGACARGGGRGARGRPPPPPGAPGGGGGGGPRSRRGCPPAPPPAGGGGPPPQRGPGGGGGGAPQTATPGGGTTGGSSS